MPRSRSPRWRDRLPFNIKRLFRVPWPSERQLARDLDDEIRFHLDMRIAEHHALGVPAEAAEREALRQFGDVADLRQYCSRSDGSLVQRFRLENWLVGWSDDLRLAARALRRRPGFVAIVTLSLAIGVSATTTAFSVVDALDLRALPYPHADRLVAITLHRKQGGFCPNCEQPTPPALWNQELRRPVFDLVTVYRSFGLAMITGDELELHRATVVTPDYFRLLGVRPELGRPITADDSRAGVQPVLVASHEYWETNLEGDRSLLGRQITLTDGTVERSYTLIGVMPPRFDMFTNSAVWVPQTEAAAGKAPNAAFVLAHLKAGVSIERATLEAAAALRLATSEDPSLRGSAVEVMTARDAVDERNGAIDRHKRLALLLVAGVILALACTNVSGLFLARLSAMDRELATRCAIGAGTWRLVRQLTLEIACVGLLGGALALPAAEWGTHMLAAALFPDETAVRLQLDWRLMMFALAVALLAGTAAGMVPSVAATRRDLASRLRLGGARRGLTLDRGMLFRAVIVGQVAGALMLAVGAGLLTKELMRLEHVPMGIDPRRLVLVMLRPEARSAQATKGFSANALQERVAGDLGRLAAVPGIEGADVEGHSGGRTYSLEVGGDSLSRDQLGGEVPVTDGYFRTMGKPILSGRAFESSDVAGGEPVGIITLEAARKLWPGQSAVGKHIVSDSSGHRETITVVGVAADTRLWRTKDVIFPVLYRPFRQLPSGFRMYWARTMGEPREVVHGLRQAIGSLQGGALEKGYSIQIAAEGLYREIETQRLSARALEGFAAFSLLLAAMGIFGLVAYGVSRQTREIGIRLALGASKSDVLGAVAGSAGKLGIAGIIVGAGAALAFGRVLRSMLFGTSPTDPLVLVASALLLAIVVGGATYGAAKRALDVDPAVSLRAE